MPLANYAGHRFIDFRQLCDFPPDQRASVQQVFVSHLVDTQDALVGRLPEKHMRLGTFEWRTFARAPAAAGPDAGYMDRRSAIVRFSPDGFRTTAHSLSFGFDFLFHEYFSVVDTQVTSHEKPTPTFVARPWALAIDHLEDFNG